VVQLWAERGILGLAAYVILLALFLRACAAAWRGPARMWAAIGVAAVVSLTIAGLFEFNFGDTEVFYLMLNLFALVLASMEEPEAALGNA
jgi:O-antigen ligase